MRICCRIHRLGTHDYPHFDQYWLLFFRYYLDEPMKRGSTYDNFETESHRSLVKIHISGVQLEVTERRR